MKGNYGKGIINIYKEIYNRYLKKIKGLKSLFIFGIILVIICQYAEIHMADVLSKVEYLKTNDTSNVNNTLLILIVCYFLAAMGNNLLGVLLCYPLQEVYKMCMGDGLREFIQLEYMKFKSIGAGKIQVMMERRSVSTGELVSTSIVTVLPTPIFMISVSYKLVKELGIVIYSIVFIFIAFYFLVTILITDYRSKLRKEVNDKINNSHNLATEIFTNYEAVKCYNNEDFEVKRYENKIAEIVVPATSLYKWFYLLNIAQKFTFAMLHSIVIVFMVKNDKYTGKNIAFYVIILQSLCSRLAILGYIYGTIVVSIANIESSRVVEFIADEDSETMNVPELEENDMVDDEEEDILDEQHPIQDLNINEITAENEIPTNIVLSTQEPQMIINETICINSEEYEEIQDINFVIINSIIFDNVTISHNHHTILENISFTINKNEKIAFIGPNGCGKSTVTKILMGFYKYKGSIRINSIELKEIENKKLRDLMTFVPQETLLMNETILANIKYGIEVEEEVVYKLARKFDIHDSIGRLSSSYMTNAGLNGKNLSGGERQKIAILRGIVRNKSVMVLDEPTASIDLKSETKIFEELLSPTFDKTIIVVVHNLSLLKRFDKIISFDNNTAVQYNSYEEYLKHRKRKIDCYVASPKTVDSKSTANVIT